MTFLQKICRKIEFEKDIFMLLQFRVKNFRSIAEEQTFSMVAGKSSSGKIEYSTRTNNSLAPYALKVATILGPNASGKSNLLKAMRFFHYFIVSSFGKTNLNNNIPVEPFKLDRKLEKSPSEFEAYFVHEGHFYQYGFTLDENRVYREWLFTKPHEKNTRMRTLFTRAYEAETKAYKWYISPSIRGEKISWKNSTRDNALFLSTAIQLNASDFFSAYHWLAEYFQIILKFDINNYVYTTNECLNPKIKPDILNMIKSIDVGICDIEATEEDIRIPKEVLSFMDKKIIDKIMSDSNAKALGLKTYHKARDGKIKAFDFNDESDGTRAFICLSAPLNDVLKHGYTLVVDEMQNSLHPKALQFIVELFMNPKLNNHGAQLIFTTHDTSILSDLLTKDQIWLVKKGSDFSTKLIPLSDFDIRAKGAFGRAYLAGKFGALPNVKDLLDNE